MTQRQALVEAIAVLQSQRLRLEDDVVDTALWALRKKLAFLAPQEPHPQKEQHQLLAVLVADLTGFTAMSSEMDPELVGDTINAIWRHVDGVVAAWGGQVDKYVGDGLIAHFGLPLPRRDDAERAVMAALEIQLVLDWFNRQRSGVVGSRPSAIELKMRIGVHLGEAFVGTVGETGGVTAVGDAVTIAGVLEHAAPPGGVLISDAVQGRIRGRFEVTSAEALLTPDEKTYVSTYLVQHRGPNPYRELMQGVAGVEARFVGRSAELEQLQDAFQMVADGSLAQLVAVIGDVGIGKSRLLDAFERWLEFYPRSVRVFRGRMYDENSPNPYALMQDVFNAYTGMPTRYSREVARETLVNDLVPQLVAAGVDLASAERYGRSISQLVGYDISVPQRLNGLEVLPTELVEMALEGLARLMEGATTEDTVAIFFLEEVDAANPAMLDLLERLLEVCSDLPVLIVCTAEPGLFEHRPQWNAWVEDPFDAYTRVDIGPLSAIDARHYVNELLNKMGRAPLRLVDLVVSVARGNPFNIEQMVNFLIENEVILQEGELWRVRLGRLDDLRLPASPPDLMRLRLMQLPAGELAVLQRGAVFGRLFPDAAVRRLGDNEAEMVLSAEDVEASLIGLETKGYIQRSQTLTFKGAQDYHFRSDAWRAAAYAALMPKVRLIYHRQAAYWLASNGNATYLKECADAIAFHFEQAGELDQAANWRKGLGRG